jgi:hypothetical protein
MEDKILPITVIRKKGDTSPCLSCYEKLSGGHNYGCTSNKRWTDCGYEYDCEGPEGIDIPDDFSYECDSCPATFCKDCAEEWKKDTEEG